MEVLSHILGFPMPAFSLEQSDERNFAIFYRSLQQIQSNRYSDRIRGIGVPHLRTDRKAFNRTNFLVRIFDHAASCISKVWGKTFSNIFKLYVLFLLEVHLLGSLCFFHEC